MPEIIVTPGLSSSIRAAAHRILVNQYGDRTQIAFEVSRLLEDAREFGWRHRDVMLGGLRGCMTEPSLQLEKTQRLPGIEKLAGNGGAGTVAGYAPTRVFQRDGCLFAQ